MKWLVDFFRRTEKQKCALCPRPVGKNSGIIRYRAIDVDGSQQTFTMELCDRCSDVFDAHAKDPFEEAKKENLDG